MRRIVAVLALASGLAGCSKPAPPPPGQPTAGKGAGAPLELPFERYTLANGLTVILHEDHSDPIVALATIVHVGSNREQPGRTGFAHFFEHMSFNNSENVPMGANRKMIPELGGTRNGGTWDDGTIYYEVVPVDAFEKLMWIDSDRFGYMINTVQQDTLEREKQVVKNEKRQRVDNAAYGHTDTVIRKALYPAGHPYSWPVIGDLEDLQKATLDDVRAFYRDYYVPGNATLVVAGDIDIARTRALIERWFGEIKGAKVVPDPVPMPVTLDRTVKLSHLDNFAAVPHLTLTFPSVQQYHPDSYALQALGAILSDGKNAALYKTIVVDAKQSSEVAAYQESHELAGTFTISVQANPDVDLDAIDGSIERALARFESEGFRDADLARVKARSETAFYEGIASILDRALQLGTFQEFAGGAEHLVEEPGRMQAVTRADVMRVYEKYVKGRHAIVTSFVPKAKPALGLDGSAVAPVVEEKIVAGAEPAFAENDVRDFPRTATKADRSEPALGPAPVVKAPPVWRHELPGGVRVLGIEHRELPMVQFHLRIDGGQQMDPAGQVGTAALVADLLDQGTKSRTPLQLEDAFGLLGADINVDASRTSIDIRGQTLARNFEQTIALVTEMVVEPRWDATEFERLKIARLSQIEERSGDPGWIAMNAMLRQVYGTDHVAGQPLGGWADGVRKIELPQLQQWWRNNASPGRATLHVVGAVGRDQVIAAMDRLDRTWTGAADGATPALPEPPGVAKPRLYFVDVPGSKQSVIVVGRAGLRGDDPLFYRATVVNSRLGDGSSARLTQILRIAKGYSYGAASVFTRERYAGPFYATSQVRTNVTLESLQIFEQQIRDYAKTFEPADLATVKNQIGKADTRRFETLDQLVRALDTMSRFGLPDDYIELQAKELAALTLDDARTLIRDLIPAKQMTYIVVGDAATQLALVSKLGMGKPVMLDRQGAPIGR